MTRTRRTTHTRRRHPRASVRIMVPALALLATAGTPLAAQDSPSTVGVIGRIAWAPSSEYGDVTGLGLELEVLPANTIVPVVRLDQWSFGIDCIGLGPCPSAVVTASLGAKLRAAGTGAATPYVGGDVGYMEWTSDVTGLSARARLGFDIRLVRYVGLNVDGSFTRFVALSGPEDSTLENSLVGISVGLTLRL